MSLASFRNRLGDLVDIPVVSATRMKTEFGTLLEKVARGGAVAISRHDAPQAVLISYEEFAALAKLRGSALDELGAAFDAMLEKMQEPAVRVANAAAFDATSEEMGAAAVRAAARTRAGVPKSRSDAKRTRRRKPAVAA
ncbi:MAG: type II toxin-antitoxin system Phd/YefM family antitoxin [Burkholderiales bacterium]